NRRPAISAFALFGFYLCAAFAAFIKHIFSLIFPSQMFIRHGHLKVFFGYFLSVSNGKAVLFAAANAVFSVVDLIIFFTFLMRKIFRNGLKKDFPVKAG